ncbi:hypothetical protein TNCV_5049361 [Trichonephila clavipes]|nr:hypothetical protein TNCV_5049361 [Trichonephila clavipes]
MGEKSGERVGQANSRTPSVSKHGYIHHNSSANRTGTRLRRWCDVFPVSSFIASCTNFATRIYAPVSRKVAAMVAEYSPCCFRRCCTVRADTCCVAKIPDSRNMMWLYDSERPI